MKSTLKGFSLTGLMLIVLSTSCASNRTLHVWKDEGYNQRLRKVLVIAVAQLDFMQKHFETGLCDGLASRGVEAVPGNKVFAQAGAKLDREAIAAKVRELGIESVLITRSVSSEDVSRLYPGGVDIVPAGYYAGWYGFYSESFAYVPVSGKAYDAEFFTIVTNVYDVKSEKLIWSSLTKVKVENSREGAIDPFISALMKQLEGGKLF
ncbi:MAG: hypothetical protein M1497_09445 [Nitrospirae bacterium]|nr:hypothetical protein [Nitrospirota bacterium]